MTIERAIQNLKEIVELLDEEINNNNKNASAILDLEDIKSLKMVLQHLKFYKKGLEREIDANRKNVIEIIQQDKEIEKKDKIINYAITEIENLRTYFSEDLLQPVFIRILEILKDKNVINW